jgi:uncharacterized protein YjiK
MNVGKFAFALAVVSATAALASPAASHAAALTGVDLSQYVRVGRFDLPEPTRTTPPANSLLAQEASAVTYDPDTDSLFVVGDGGTSVVQVSKTGALINSMTLAQGSSPQGTEFYDTEGIAYVGGGKFVLSEERDRKLNLFTYVPNTTLTRAAVQTVKLGTTIGNTGIEGLTNDPQTGGFVVVKEADPEGIFQTGVDFAAGTATNGSPTTENSTDLFNPALAGLSDFSDVFALSNLTTLTGPDKSHLLILSQEAGKIVNVDRAGTVSSSLTIVKDADNPLTVPNQSHEGLAMDNDGKLYVVSEEGGGDVGHPQLWVYAPSTGSNQAPTAVTLGNPVTTIAEGTSTTTRVKVADVTVADDAVGTNTLTVTGADAASFEVDSTGLYLKAGTVLNRTTKPSYSVAVAVDDTTVGATPDATSATLTLTVTAAAASPSLVISEVSPWSSGDSPYGADWFEVTNKGTSAVNLAGFKVDDNSNAFASAIALTGVNSIAPGQSVIFIEGSAATAAAFKTFWFGTNVPAGFEIGTYSGSGIGLSTDGDAVNLFDSAGTKVTGVSFGASTTFFTFDNAAGLTGSITALSAAGRNGAVTVSGATGSPGTIATNGAQVTAGGAVIGLVPAQLALTLGGPATFAPFMAAVAKDYEAQTTATVTSTGGDAALSVVDAGPVAPGHLVSGTFALPQALQVNANGGAYRPVSGTPAGLLTYAGPVSGDVVNVGLKQTIGATDALRTGAYAKTLTFVLSTTTP